jgi:hypothetical protein
MSVGRGAFWLDLFLRRFLSTSGQILHRRNHFIVRLDRRTHSPVLRQADLPEITVPWLGGRTVHYEFA